MRKRTLISCIGMFAAAVCLTAHAEEMIYSGFMSDYSQLEKVTDGTADYRYIAPGGEDLLIGYNAIMIDQPEVFIAVDSEYGGVKPKHLHALAESLRAAIAAGMPEDFYVVERPGASVLYLSVAITNVKLKKRKKKVYNFVPVALVVGGIAGAATSDLAKKADLTGAVLEIEGFDSVSGERIFAVIDNLGEMGAEPASWEDLDMLMTRYGGIASCRINNSRLPEDERVNCLADR